MSRLTRLFLSISCAFYAVSCTAPGTTAPNTTQNSGAAGQQVSRSEVDFTTQIKPLLESRCLVCHNTGTLLGHLNLEMRAYAFQPGPDGPFIVPGQPEKSKLYTFTLLSEGSSQAMPPTKHRLSAKEKTLLYDWIAQGAEWPRGPEGTLKTIPDPAG